MKRKVLALTLSLLLAFSLAACGSKETDNTSDVQVSSEEESSVEESSDVQEDVDADTSSNATKLQEWMDSEEAAQTIETTNQVLSSSGMTIDLAADGNVFVYEYYVSDSLGLSALSKEEISASLQPVVDSQSAAMDTIFDTFETAYDIKLEAIRFAFFTEAGEEIFSCDIPNK